MNGNSTKRWTENLPPIILITACWIVYANSLSGVFLFDDHLHIIDNPAIRQWDPVRALFGGDTSRPLLTLSLSANYAIGGLDVRGYHILNIMVHLIAGLALYGVVRRTLQLDSVPERFGQSAESIGLATALIWTVHPLQTQAVTYIVQRCESMMGMCFLLSMYGVIRGATSGSRWSTLWYVSAVVAFVLGLMSKQVMVTALPVILLYDRVFLSASWRAVLKQRGWFYLALLIPLVFSLSSIFESMFSATDSTAGFSMKSVSSLEYARSQPAVILHYLGLCLCPFPQCLDYGWPVATRWLSEIIVPSLVMTTLVVVSFVALFRGGRIGFVAVAFFLILAPTSSIMPIQDLCVEHRMYLPSACVVAFLVLGAFWMLQRFPPGHRRFVATTGLLLVTVGLGNMTVARNRVYHSATAIWSDVLYYPRKDRQTHVVARAANNLADDMIRTGHVEQAVEILRRTLRSTPNSAEVHANLGSGLMKLGAYAESRQHYEEAVRIQPEVGRFRQQLGLVAAAEGHLDEAEKHLQEAGELAPNDAIIWFNFGQCLTEQGKFERAIVCFRQAFELDPKLGAAQARLALVQLQAGNQLRKQGDFVAAIHRYRQAIRIEPNSPEAHNNLGALIIKDDPSLASTHFRQAIELQPEFLQARFNLAVALTQLGRRNEAIRQYQQLLDIEPNLPIARTNLLALLDKDHHSDGLSPAVSN